MTTEPNIFTNLILYSVLSGVFLRLTHDSLKVIAKQFYSRPRPILRAKSKRVISQSVSVSATDQPPSSFDIIPQPPLLQNTSTLKSIVKSYCPPIGKAQVVITAVTDVIFALIAALTVTLLLFGLNYGEMRWFVLPLVAAGYFLYGETVGVPLRAILAVAVGVILKISFTVLSLLLAPFIAVIRKLYTLHKRKRHTKRKKREGKPKPQTKPLTHPRQVSKSSEKKKRNFF